MLWLCSPHLHLLRSMHVHCFTLRQARVAAAAAATQSTYAYARASRSRAECRLQWPLAARIPGATVRAGTPGRSGQSSGPGRRSGTGATWPVPRMSHSDVYRVSREHWRLRTRRLRERARLRGALGRGARPGPPRTTRPHWAAASQAPHRTTNSEW